MPSHLPPATGATKAGPLPSIRSPGLPRYYEPLGLPPDSRTLRTRLIARVFAGRRRSGRASPVPLHTVATCRLPYPGRVLDAAGSTRPVCCLRPDMTGSAPPPFGAYVTGLQRFTLVRPAALLPSDGPYGPPRASDAPHRWRDLSPVHPEPATRRTGLLTATGLTPASLEQLGRTHHGRSLLPEPIQRQYAPDRRLRDRCGDSVPRSARLGDACGAQASSRAGSLWK